MATYIENKTIILNSDNATKMNGDYNSSVYFQFVGLLNDDPSIRSVSLAVQNAQFPYSFYNVNVYNNLLKISVNSSPAVVLALTRGNYNATTLISEIQAQLTSNGITDITISISSITGLLTFTKSTGSFTIYNDGSTCFKLLGFSVQNYSSTGGVLVAPFPLNLLGTLKIRIASYRLSINSIDSSVNGSLNVLTSIPINAGNFGLVMYENTTNITNPLNLRALDGFDLEILDDDGNLINFNNAYWTLSLLMQIERVVTAQSISTFSEITKMEPSGPNFEKAKDDAQNENDFGEEELYVEAPNFDDTIVADDLDLLLYSSGIR
jgi:hypothetical protein